MLFSASEKEENQKRNQDFRKPQGRHQCHYIDGDSQRPSGNFFLLLPAVSLHYGLKIAR